MKSFTLVFCAILISSALSPLYAVTKAEQVERYLGKYRYENDKPLGTVKFIFQEAVLKRQGDGKKTYEQLLFNERYFSNRDNAGHLIGIQVVYKGKTTTIRPESPTDPDEVEAPAEQKPKPKPKAKPASELGKEIASQSKSKSSSAPAPVEATYQTSNDPVRPRLAVTENPGGGGIQIPDSSTIVHNIDQAKEKITTWKGRMWQTIRPVWEFVMWVFSSIIVMLICFAGICRYVAKTAASESLMNSYGRIIVGRWIVSAHQNAAAMLLVITWVIAIVLLIDVFMWLVFLSLPIWTLLVIWFPILWLAEKLTSWIVPNIPVIGPRT